MEDKAIILKYIARTVGPIHIGQRINSEDDISAHKNIASTARDSDGFPYIPASSLKGCVRALSASEYSLDLCDGKGWNCPQPHLCPSCAVFGFANYHQGKSSSSLVRFSSPSLLALPISTPVGAIWLTSWLRLERSQLVTRSSIQPGTWAFGEALNQEKFEFIHKIMDHSVQSGPSTQVNTGTWFGDSELRGIYENIAIVDESSLAQVANISTSAQLSISIDSATEIARPGSLFGVEAIPKESLLAFEVVYIDPKSRGIQEFVYNRKFGQHSRIPATLDSLVRIIETGLKSIEMFGIGGKRSRGFGSLRVYPADIDRRINPQVNTETNSSKTPDVMISYSHADNKTARRLAANLQEQGLFVWLDEHQVLIGDSIHEAVGTAIRDCRYLVVLLSKNSIQSNWVQSELNIALTREKSKGGTIVLPMIIDTLRPVDIPLFLQDKKCGSLYKRYVDGIQELLLSIRVRDFNNA